MVVTGGQKKDNICWRPKFLVERRKICFPAAKSLQSCLTLCDPVDSSPSGSPVLGILQARTLEWVARHSFVQAPGSVEMVEVVSNTQKSSPKLNFKYIILLDIRRISLFIFINFSIFHALVLLLSFPLYAHIFIALSSARSLFKHVFMKHLLGAQHFTLCEKYDHQEIYLNLIHLY